LEDPDPALRLLEQFPSLSTVVLLPLGPDVLTGLLVILFLLILSSLISGSETAFFGLQSTGLHSLKKEESGRARLVPLLLERPKRLLATILIANIFFNVAIVILSTFISLRLFDFNSHPYLGFIIQAIVITSLILLFGEIMPKIYASQQQKNYAIRMAPLLRSLVSLFYPLSSLLINTTGIIDRRYARKGHNLSMSELSEAIEITSDGDTAEEDKKILKGIVKFGDIAVREIMKARIDVTAVDTSLEFEALIDTIIHSGYSRIPAYEGSFDQISGILYIKDLLPYLGKARDIRWQELLRPGFFVPENKRISELLREFQEKKIHMAIVVDEYGGTSGIVTLEDIIEEIVGEISDEFDVDSDEILHQQVSDNQWVFEGKASLNDFCKIMNIDDRVFEHLKGESDTLAGLILETEGNIPEKNTEIRIPPFTFLVEDADSRRINRILVTRESEPNEDD
jgi:gliding motility-associated protein GldE